MLTKTKISFLGLKYHGITLIIFVLLFISNPLLAQDVWQKTKIYPGSQNLLSVAATFEEGWERNTQNYSQWFRFSDKQYRSPQTWEKVQPKVTKTYNFTINTSGYLTFMFKTHVAKEVFYHQDPKFTIFKLKDNGKWENIWLGFTVYSECFHGAKPTSGSNKNLFLYQINADNTLRYYTVPPLYKPGQYRLVIEAAKRVGAYDLTYVPSEASLQVYFISKDTRIEQGYDKPQLGNYSTGVSHKGFTHESNRNSPDISGTWKWFDGEIIHIYSNGTATDGFNGKWKANWNGSGFTYTINWNNGQYIDKLSLHGNTLNGHNQNGTHVWGKKILSDSWKTGNTLPNTISGQVNTVTPALNSGTYRVEQGQWKSTWRLHVSNGQISGTSEWSCCPGHRIDPVRGTVSGNSVIIERDCSGQRWNGSCRQTYKGTIKGDRITGPCSGTGLTAGDTWVLYLNKGSSLQPSIKPWIGSIWQVEESCATQKWIGTWIRRPGTKTFDATWKSKQTGQEVRDVIDFKGIKNGILTLYRHGIKGTYTGKISSNGMNIKDGDASWYHGSCHWTANINE